jgi:hypothetical protein
MGIMGRIEVRGKLKCEVKNVVIMRYERRNVVLKIVHANRTLFTLEFALQRRMLEPSLLHHSIANCVSDY